MDTEQIQISFANGDSCPCELLLSLLPMGRDPQPPPALPGGMLTKGKIKSHQFRYPNPPGCGAQSWSERGGTC